MSCSLQHSECANILKLNLTAIKGRHKVQVNVCSLYSRIIFAFRCSVVPCADSRLQLLTLTFNMHRKTIPSAHEKTKDYKNFDPVSALNERKKSYRKSRKQKYTVCIEILSFVC